jgi:N-acyl-D-amino-acid deacylase
MIRVDRGMLDGRVLIASSVPHPECAGRDLADIAADWGVDRAEAARRLQPGSAVYFLMDEGRRAATSWPSSRP